MLHMPGANVGNCATKNHPAEPRHIAARLVFSAQPPILITSSLQKSNRRMTRTASRISLGLLMLFALTGCKIYAGSYQIDNSKSFTLIRETRYFWSQNVERWFTVSRMPDCQRKHRMSEDSKKDIEDVRLRKVDDVTYQVQSGKEVYLADLQACTFILLPKGTEKEGQLIGKFTAAVGNSIPFEVAGKSGDK